MRNDRQRMLVKLISEEHIGSQEQLVKRLEESGFTVTQATVSRDMKELGVIKMRDESGVPRLIIQSDRQPAAAAVFKDTHSDPCCVPKNDRQRMLLKLISEEHIGSQEQLVKRLEASGYTVTQSTASRDLKELGVVKTATESGYRFMPSAPIGTDKAECDKTVSNVQKIERNAVIDRTLPTEEKLKIALEEIKRRIASGDAKVEKTEELVEQYPDLPLSSLRNWIKQCTGKSAKEYLIENGILMNTRELYLSRISSTVVVSFNQYTSFAFEESERYRAGIDEIMKRLKQAGVDGYYTNMNQVYNKSVESLKEKYGDNWGLHDLGLYFGPIHYFVVDPTDKNVDGEKYKTINNSVYRDKTVITLDHLLEQIDQHIQNTNDFMNEFRNETDETKLERALNMFVRCVEKVEKEMDRSNQYNDPCIKYATIDGKLIADSLQLKKAESFFDAIGKWMETHELGYDFRETPKEIKEWASKYYNERIRGWADLEGLVGVRCPIAIAVAFINYAAPVANISLEWARDKWELRGDYNSGDLVCLNLSKYNEKEKITHSSYEAYDM